VETERRAEFLNFATTRNGPAQMTRNLLMENQLLISPWVREPITVESALFTITALSLRKCPLWQL